MPEIYYIRDGLKLTVRVFQNDFQLPEEITIRRFLFYQTPGRIYLGYDRFDIGTRNSQDACNYSTDAEIKNVIAAIDEFVRFVNKAEKSTNEPPWIKAG
jgi:hypothetical protein